MHIRKLELHGFKSFPDRTVFHFSSGISGVVGPNGCGKSNVVDAVRWVLGEQRPKQLRGQAMQDIIFAGSSERDAMEEAAVTLHFVADDEPFPGDYARLDELQVTRKLARDGSSEYLINHQKVRLKDVQELFLDSGAANPLYSFIEQGRIGQIVRARPEERRSLIEEAAGISRYKLKRKETEQRLLATQENLDRVADVVAGHANRLQTLEKQVVKAVKHRRMTTLIRQGEVFLGLAKYAGLAGDRKVLMEQSRTALNDELAAKRTVERALEAQVTLRARQQKSEDEIAVVRERRAELEASRRERISGRDHLIREKTGLHERQRLMTARRSQTDEALEAARVRAQAAAVELAEVSEELAAQESIVDGGQGEMRELEGALRERRRRVDVARQQSVDLAGRKARAEAAESGATRRLSDIAAARSRLDAQTAEAGSDLQQLVQSVEQLSGEETRGTEAAAEARTAAKAIQDRAAEAEGARADALRERRNAERAAAEAERATGRLVARLESLQALHDARGEVGVGVKRLLGRPGVYGVLAELLDVPVAAEADLLALLGPRLDAVVVDEASLPGVLSVALDERIPLMLVPADDSALSELPAALADIAGHPAALRALRGCVGGARYATDPAEAVRLAVSNGVTVAIQGAAGGPALVRPDRVVEMGRVGAVGGEVLRRKREIAELRDQVEQARATETLAAAALEAARVAVRAAEDSRERVDAELRDARKVAGEREMELGGVRRRLEDQRRLLERERGRNERLVAEVERLNKEQAEAESARAQASSTMAEVMVHAERVEAELAVEQAALSDESVRVDARRKMFAELNASVAALRERKAGLERAVATSTETVQASEKLLTELSVEEQRVDARLKVLAAELDRLSSELAGIEAQKSTIEKEMIAVSELQAGMRVESAKAEAAVVAARDAREASSAKRTDLEQRLARVKEEIAQVRADVQDKHEQNVSGLLDRLERDGTAIIVANLEPPISCSVETGGTDPEDLRVTRAMVEDEKALSDWAEEVSKARKGLARLGAVNLVAVEEYRELSEEHANLEAQRADLERSLRAIRKTLAQLNRVSRERFRETFERVDAYFQEMYPRLMGGGQARLGLTNEEDLLETGVEVYVQPPGKRLQALSLLSGGETAMVAIALIFSLFKVKPSPFCLLDEVDAPLDEANGGRFNSMLSEMSDLSQFIVITHNKKTMECVDTLYGVTMTSPGVSRLVTVSLDADSQRPSPG